LWRASKGLKLNFLPTYNCDNQTGYRKTYHVETQNSPPTIVMMLTTLHQAWSTAKTPLNHWTVAAHSNQLTCYQISNPQSGCHVSFAIYHNSCHVCTWIDKILKALPIAIKCLHDDYVSGCIDCSCLRNQLLVR